MNLILVFMLSIIVGCSDSDFNMNEISDLSNPLVRQTVYGKVRGVEFANNTWAWLGIPFAKPPVGELRWKAPRDPDSWDGILATGEFCSACPQYGGMITFMDTETVETPVGSENCLYLNVWRPRTEEKNLPVFLYIHGGGNEIGLAGLKRYYGDAFAGRSNMIFVSINYRLGPIGWFTHPAFREGDPLDDSGNYGTLDVIKALEWVRDNIQAFGGDPNNVTLAGQSAGAWNVYSMMVSPLANGLFHRAIAQSSVMGPKSKAVSDGESSAEGVICQLLINDGYAANETAAKAFMEEKGNRWVADYMRSQPFSDIYHCFQPMASGTTQNNGGQIYVDGAVIPDTTMNCLSSGNYTKVPIIIGSTREELKLFLPLIVGEQNEREFCETVRNFDPDNPNVALEDMLHPMWWAIYEPVLDVVTLLLRAYSVDVVAGMLAMHQDDIYVYEFAWDEQPEPFGFLTGSGHAVDVPFAFDSFSTDQSEFLRYSWSEANRPGRERLSAAMMAYWAQFARTGNPNVEGLETWGAWTDMANVTKSIVFDTEISLTAETALDTLAEMGYLTGTVDIVELVAGGGLGEFLETPEGTINGIKFLLGFIGFPTVLPIP